MKKLVLTGLALVAGAALSYAQGTITMSVGTANEVQTNGTSLAGAGGTGWTYEVLDMSQAAYNGLTSGQQAGVYNLINNQSDFSLWTDAGVSGTGNSLHAGGITSSGAAATQNWAAPTGLTYSTGTIDYYTILGWNASLGTWATVQSELTAGTLGGSGWFGQSAVAYNYSGGGPNGLAAVNLFATTAQTQLAGSGGLPAVGGIVLNSLTPVPEPATLALAGLGGISMLFLRRRKS